MAHAPRRFAQVADAYRAILASLEAEADLAMADAKHARGNDAPGVAGDDNKRAHWLEAAADDVRRALALVEG